MRGFSLIETLVATTIMTVGLVGLAQLFAISAKANRAAWNTTVATVLARQKMEQLRSLAWGFDAVGQPLTDTTTDLTTVPERANGGKGLSLSPEDALRRNVEGYCDFLDGRGHPLGGGATPHPGTAYIRRWSVEPLPANPDNTIVLRVLVTWRMDRAGSDRSPRDDRRSPEAVRLVSAKTRKAP